MKRINVYFEDKEFKALKKIKGDLNWHDFILLLLKEGEKDNDL